MNKETKEIIDLLGKETFLDEVFKFKSKNIDSEDIETNFKNPEYLYKTKDMADYWFVGVAENKLIASSYDDMDDYSFYDKEEFYLIPFLFFSKKYSNREDLDKMNYESFEYELNYDVKNKFNVTYYYSKNMIKYIEWYKEQGYPMYEYIPKLEAFLREQIEFWKDKFEKIKNEE